MGPHPETSAPAGHPPAGAGPVVWADGKFNQCACRMGGALICNRVAGHDGDHIDYDADIIWHRGNR
jgi:hypothetical protein